VKIPTKCTDKALLPTKMQGGHFLADFFIHEDIGGIMIFPQTPSFSKNCYIVKNRTDIVFDMLPS